MQVMVSSIDGVEWQRSDGDSGILEWVLMGGGSLQGEWRVECPECLRPEWQVHAPSNRSRFIASLSRGWEFRAAPVSSLKRGRRSPSHQELGFPFSISRGPEGAFPFFPHRPRSPKSDILCIYPSHKLLPVGLAWSWGTPQLDTGCWFLNQVTTQV